MENKYLSVLSDKARPITKECEDITRNRELGRDCTYVYMSIMPIESAIEEQILNLYRLKTVIQEFKNVASSMTAPTIEPIGLILDIKEENDVSPKKILEMGNEYDDIYKAIYQSSDEDDKFEFISTVEDIPEMVKVIHDKCKEKTKAKTRSKEITKKVVKEALKRISESGLAIEDLIYESEKYKSAAKEYTVKLNRTIADLGKEFKDDGMKDMINAAVGKANLCIQECIICEYINARADEIMLEFKNSCAIVEAADMYDPRNMKQSLVEVQEIADNLVQRIDSIYHASSNIDLETYAIEETAKEQLLKAKSKMIQSDERFLKKYKEQALKSNCIGITIEKWNVPIDVKKRYNKIIKEIEKLFSTDRKSYEELKAAYDELKGGIFGGGKGSDVAGEMIDNVELGFVSKIAHKVERDHKVTKADVKAAVKFLEQDTAKIEEMRNKVQEDAFASSSNISISIPSLTKTKNERLIKKMNRMKDKLIDDVNLNYSRMLLSQLTVGRQQARLVILKAARTKNVKEAGSPYIRSDIQAIEEILQVLNPGDTFQDIL